MPIRNRPRGFTLIELLVVILIIGILAGLILAAMPAVKRAAYRAAVSAEMSAVTAAIKSAQAHHGQPFSQILLSETGRYDDDFLDAQLPGLANRYALARSSVQIIQRAWPRVQLLPNGGAVRPPGIGFYDFNGNGTLDLKPYVLDGSECLAFYLGGVPKPYQKSDGTAGFGMIGWANNRMNPFQPDSFIPPTSTLEVTPSREASQFTFKTSQLEDHDGDGFPRFNDCFSSEPTPYAFFVASSGEYDPSHCDSPTEPDGSPSPVGAFRYGGAFVSSPAPNPYTTGPALPVSGAYASGPLATGVAFRANYVNRDSFQLICAGADRRFGPGGQYDGESTEDKLPYPALATSQAPGGVVQGRTARDVEADNQVNNIGGVLGK